MRATLERAIQAEIFFTRRAKSFAYSICCMEHARFGVQKYSSRRIAETLESNLENGAQKLVQGIFSATLRDQPSNVECVKKGSSP